MNFTTVEQSKKLLELGLSPESADMFWEKDQNCIGIKAYNLNTTIRYTKKELSELFAKDKDIIPCWSVGALLDLLPYSIKVKNIDYTITLEGRRLMYKHFSHYQGGITYIHVMFCEKTIIDTCYNMVVWLLEKTT